MSANDRSQQVRKSLADARLVGIEPDEFPARIREVKQVAIGHLGELLQSEAGLHEPRSVAHALGTLSRLEATLRAGPAPGPSKPAGPPANDLPQESRLPGLRKS